MDFEGGPHGRPFSSHASALDRAEAHGTDSRLTKHLSRSRNAHSWLHLNSSRLGPRAFFAAAIIP
ncbi:MAG: hypothetical protein ABSC25_27760, partial [Roseiarcus sp.]